MERGLVSQLTCRTKEGGEGKEKKRGGGEKRINSPIFEVGKKGGEKDGFRKRNKDVERKKQKKEGKNRFLVSSQTKKKRGRGEIRIAHEKKRKRGGRKARKTVCTSISKLPQKKKEGNLPTNSPTGGKEKKKKKGEGNAPSSRFSLTFRDRKGKGKKKKRKSVEGKNGKKRKKKKKKKGKRGKESPITSR